MLEIAGVIVFAFLTYLFGRRQAEHERLYERRAEVIAGLFERFETVDQRLYSLIKPHVQAGEPDPKEKARLAAESFNEAQSYYRGNSIWLSRRTSAQIAAFLSRYRQTFRDFVERESEYPIQEHRRWVAVWTRFEKESPEIREMLEMEFRSALGDKRSQIALLWRRLRSGQEGREEALETPIPAQPSERAGEGDSGSDRRPWWKRMFGR